MKTFIFLFTMAALALPVLAQTQAEMDDESAADFKKADKKLNAVYKELRDSLDEDGQAKLKIAQKAWITFRDAETELEAAPNEGGTIYPLVFANVKTRITKARTDELQAVIDDSTTRDDEQSGGDDAAHAPKDANGNAYGDNYNPDGADDPNQ